MTNYKPIIWIVTMLAIVLSSCTSQEVTCNSPYIKVGTSCCLDQDSNSICDNDETKKESSVESIKKVDIKEEPKTQGGILDGELYQIALVENDLGKQYFFDKADSGYLDWINDKEAQKDDFIKLVVDNHPKDILYLSYHVTNLSGTFYISYRTIRFEDITSAKRVFSKYYSNQTMEGYSNIGDESVLLFEEYVIESAIYSRIKLNFRTGNLITRIVVEGKKGLVNVQDLVNYGNLINTRILDKSKRININTNPYTVLKKSIETIYNYQNNVGLILSDLSFEDKGEWGKINSMEIEVQNNGPNNLYPIIRIFVFDKENPSTSDLGSPKDTFELEGLPTDYSIKNIYNTKISFSNINKTKILRVTVGNLFDDGILVSIDKEINFKDLGNKK